MSLNDLPTRSSLFRFRSGRNLQGTSDNVIGLFLPRRQISRPALFFAGATLIRETRLSRAGPSGSQTAGILLTRHDCRFKKMIDR
jgi:hypothetical protein